MILDALLFSDYQVIFTKSEDGLQMATLQLHNIMVTYNLEILHDKTNNMAFCGKYQISAKIILNTKIIEQVQSFNYLGCDISFTYDRDLSQKVCKFQYACGTIKRTLRNKTRKDTMLKYYKVMAVPMLMYGSENWTMNRADRRRIEAAEMKFLRYVAG
jgi:hypothetical protein